MKKYTTIKTGYTAGIYGCSGEYFTCLIENGDKSRSIHFKGMYGAEDRVNAVLNDAGYKHVWSNCNYGQLRRKDIFPGTLSEYKAIDEIKKIIAELD